MNRWKTVGVTVLILGVVAGALALGLSGGDAASSNCRGRGVPVVHAVTIRDGNASPARVNAKLCDMLTITNQDSTSREIAFGLHEHHEPYDGVTERLLGKGESLTVTLNQAGSFRWHDHIHDEVQGFFTVAQ